MSKKRIIVSSIGLVLSLAAFIFAAWAWFTVSHQVSAQPINFEVSRGIFSSYEVRYFTSNNVYRMGDAFDPDITEPQMYYPSTSSWGTPSYAAYQEVGSFDGVLMSYYDPLIVVNNFYNNLIIELYVTYNLDTTKTVSVKALIDTALAGTLPDDLEGRDLGDSPYTHYVPDSHYLSEVVNIQHTTYDGITDFAFGTNGRGSYLNDSKNIYSEVSDYFNDEANASNIFDYTFSDPESDLDLTTPGSDTFTISGSGSRYIYFNYSYDVTKVISIVNARYDESLLTYYFGTDGDIYDVDLADVDESVYTASGGGIYTDGIDNYEVDTDGNLVYEGTTDIKIPANYLFDDETSAHDFTDFVRFYPNIKLSVGW